MVRGRSPCPHSSVSHGTYVSWTYVSPVHASIVSVNSYVCQPSYIWKNCFWEVIYPLWLFWILLLLFQHIFPRSEGQMEENIPLRIEWSKIYHLMHIIQLSVSVFPYTASNNFSDDGWLRHEWDRNHYFFGFVLFFGPFCFCCCYCVPLAEH